MRVFLLLLLALCSARGAAAACNATIDDFGSTALHQGLEVQIGSNAGAFGEQMFSQPANVITVRPLGRVTNDLISSSVNGGTGTIDSLVNMINCTTVAQDQSIGVISSRDSLISHSGVTSAGKFTSVWPEGGCVTSECLLAAGLFSTTDGIYIGYYDNQGMGVLLQAYGEPEVQRLYIVDSIAATTVNVTISGRLVADIPVSGGTAAATASEIATYLFFLSLSSGDLLSTYSYFQNGDTVLVVGRNAVENVGAFSITNGTNVTGYFLQEQAAAAYEREFIPQAEWNGEDVSWMDPTKINVFQIQFGYLGVANIKFMVMNPTAERWQTIHTFRKANTVIKPHVHTPSVRVGWVAFQPLGGTDGTVVSVGGASASLFRSQQNGITRLNTRAFTHSNPTVGTTEEMMFQIRVRDYANGHVVVAEISPVLMAVGTSSTRGVKISAYAGCEMAGIADWAYVSEVDSVVEADTSATFSCAAGYLLFSTLVHRNSALAIPVKDYNLWLSSRTSVIFTAAVISGGDSEVDVSLTWAEDQ